MPTAQKPDALPVVAWRVRHLSEPQMIGHYPWSFTERILGSRMASYEYDALVRLSDAQASLLAKEAECEALREQVVWAMDNMGMRDTHAEFVAHVLRRGGTGDYSDCATFIDAARAAADKGGAS